jgi:hypothetical protein
MGVRGARQFGLRFSLIKKAHIYLLESDLCNPRSQGTSAFIPRRLVGDWKDRGELGGKITLDEVARPGRLSREFRQAGEE